MNWLVRGWSSLERRDRRLLSACLALAVCMVVVIAVFAPTQAKDDPTPSSYGAGNHGAKAAYLTLQKLGYAVQRWTEPLNQLAERADGHTTLILANPFIADPEEERKAIATILQRGGRVLAAGGASASLLPHRSTAPFMLQGNAECKAVPIGFDPETADSVTPVEDVHMREWSYWQDSQPVDRAQYECEHHPVVVTFREGKGKAIWWGDTLPLENRGIVLGDNLGLLLRSVGPATGNKIYWDESLHGEAPSVWSYAKGTPVQLALLQVVVAAALLFFSYGRRSGPLRGDPVNSRASPVEFARSLAGLFHKAHASNAAVAIAYQDFRRELQVHFGIAPTVGAAEAAAAVQRRSPDIDKTLVANMELAENAAAGDSIAEGKAITLVQALEDDARRLFAVYRPNAGREGNAI